MRIAAISDIHGNLHALEAVLTDIARRGVDITVNLGDMVSGPLQPRETAERLMAMALPTISGNHERQVLSMRPQDMGASDRYALETLTSAQRAWIAALPATIQPCEGVFLCHATPENDVDCYLENICDGELVPASLAQIEARTAECPASLILCGHSHIPRVAQLNAGQVIVNPGSVGIQAYNGHHPIAHRVQIGSPHARYAIAQQSGAVWKIDLIAVPYDWESSARLAQLRNRPDWARALRSGFL